MRGEDSRRATIALEMMDTGDWIVPRQQGVPYLSRPPVHSWTMAGLAYMRGELDYWAIRLPSVAGVLGMVLVVYAVGVMTLGNPPALVGAAAMASLPQVLEMGRTGETDPMFSFLVSSSMLLWFVGYSKNWPRGVVWSLGYALAALATLTKGIQATPYFVGATWLFLICRRDWRWLFSWGHLAGLVTWVIVFGAWALPFVNMMSWASLGEVFKRDSRDQFLDTSVQRYLRQMVTMPGRIAGSVLPWLALLGVLWFKPARQWVARQTPLVSFILIAMAVAWPTVWLSPTSQNRHYMPLYPCMALLFALMAGAALRVTDSPKPGKYWRDFLGVLSVVMLVIGVGFSAMALDGVRASLTKILPKVDWSDAQIDCTTALIFLIGALLTGLIAQWASWKVDGKRMQIGALAVAVFVGLLMVGPVATMDIRRSVNVGPSIRELRQTMGDKPLVSYGATAHLFAYYFREPIKILPFPTSTDDAGAQVEYFSYYSGSEGIEDPKLPFEWEKVGAFNCDRFASDKPRVLIVVGRRTQ